MNDLSIKLETSFVMPNEYSDPIVIQNPTVRFRWKAVFMEGEVSFSTFESMIDEELFNFDIDFIRPLQDGNMMLVGKPVTIKIALKTDAVCTIFNSRMTLESFTAIFKKEIKKNGSLLLDEYNWLVCTMSQVQGSKTVGHETMWNLLEFENPKIVEDWSLLVNKAAAEFTGNPDIDFFEDNEDDEMMPPDDFSRLIEDAKTHISDKNNPLSTLFSEIFDNENNLNDALSEKMGAMLSLFSDDNDDDNYDEEYEFMWEVVEEHLDMLGFYYQHLETDEVFLVEKKNEKGTLSACIIKYDEAYLHVTTVYERAIPQKKWDKLYRLINGLNFYIPMGKLILVEEEEMLSFRTELSAPIMVINPEPIIDTIDENWSLVEDLFDIVTKFIDGKITHKEAIEKIITFFE